MKETKNEVSFDVPLKIIKAIEVEPKEINCNRKIKQCI